MARIQVVKPTEARGIRRLLVRIGMRQYGFIPGLVQVQLPDLQFLFGTAIVYNRLHLAKSSSMTRLQREMVATVVNGKVGGAP